jgi:hypothetical protein
MSSAASYASSPRTAAVSISTANTARDGTGTLGTVLTAGASGSRIETLTITATGTTTAGMVRLFLYDGTTYYLWREVQVSAKTPSATDSTFTSTLSAIGLVLSAGWSLRASTHNAEAFNVLATLAGDF